MQLQSDLGILYPYLRSFLHFLPQEEAEELYKKSQRNDLLNQFYQASGQWAKVKSTT